MAIRLRHGGIKDFETVYRLNKAVFTEYWSSQSLRTALESGYGLMLCEVDDMAVGYLLSLQVLDEIQVMQIGVLSDYRRRGLARLMTEKLIDSCRGAAAVTLEVRLSNAAARNLYISLGFEEAGYRKNYYAPDASGCREDAVLMTRRL